MLAQIGVIPDQVLSPDIDETAVRDEPPRVYALRMASEKAAPVLGAPSLGAYVLSADTVVALGRRILPKAADADAVRDCLGRLSGRRHTVITAIALVTPAGDRSTRVSVSTVTFARLTSSQIDAYAASGEGEGKAGGYAIQGRAAAYVRAMSGSYSGIVGLPLFETAQLLRGRGYPLP